MLEKCWKRCRNPDLSTDLRCYSLMEKKSLELMLISIQTESPQPQFHQLLVFILINITTQSAFILSLTRAVTSYEGDQKHRLPAVHILSLHFHLKTQDFLTDRSFPTCRILAHL